MLMMGLGKICVLTILWQYYCTEIYVSGGSPIIAKLTNSAVANMYVVDLIRCCFRFQNMT